MTKIRVQIIRFYLLWQLFFIAIAGSCQSVYALHVEATSVLMDLGFSYKIVKHAFKLERIFYHTKVRYSVGNVKELFTLLNSSWGVHLRPEEMFTTEVRNRLDKLIQQIGLHEVYREKHQFTQNQNTNSLMIYLGAHPSVLCHSLNDIKDLVPYIHHALIVTSRQKYPRYYFESCDNLRYSHQPLLANLSSQSPLHLIMHTYLKGLDIKLETISYADLKAVDINNSKRLRLYLRENPKALGKYNKIIIVAPQPLGEEAYMTVTQYVDQARTAVYRLFSLPEVSLHDDLSGLSSLLEADYEFNQQKKQTPEHR